MKLLSFFLILYSQTFIIVAQAQEPHTPPLSFWLTGQWHSIGSSTANLFGFEDSIDISLVDMTDSGSVLFLERIFSTIPII